MLTEGDGNRKINFALKCEGVMRFRRPFATRPRTNLIERLRLGQCGLTVTRRAGCRKHIIRLPSGLSGVGMARAAKATCYTNGPAEVTTFHWLHACSGPSRSVSGSKGHSTP